MKKFVGILVVVGVLALIATGVTVVSRDARQNKVNQFNAAKLIYEQQVKETTAMKMNFIED